MPSPIAWRSSGRRLLGMITWIGIMITSVAITEMQTQVAAPEDQDYTFALNLQCLDSTDPYRLNPSMQTLEPWLKQQVQWESWQSPAGDGGMNIFAYGCQAQPVVTQVSWFVLTTVIVLTIACGIGTSRIPVTLFLVLAMGCTSWMFFKTGLPLFRGEIADAQICQPFVSRSNEFNDTLLEQTRDLTFQVSSPLITKQQDWLNAHILASACDGIVLQQSELQQANGQPSKSVARSFTIPVIANNELHRQIQTSSTIIFAIQFVLCAITVGIGLFRCISHQIALSCGRDVRGYWAMFCCACFWPCYVCFGICCQRCECRERAECCAGFCCTEICDKLCAYDQVATEESQGQDALRPPTIDEAKTMGGGTSNASAGAVASHAIDVPLHKDGEDLNLGISVSLPSAPLPLPFAEGLVPLPEDLVALPKPSGLSPSPLDLPKDFNTSITPPSPAPFAALQHLTNAS